MLKFNNWRASFCNLVVKQKTLYLQPNNRKHEHKHEQTNKSHPAICSKRAADFIFIACLFVGHKLKNLQFNNLYRSKVDEVLNQ